MANKRVKGVSSSLTPSPQEEEKGRVLKPLNEESTKKPKARDERTRKGRTAYGERGRKQRASRSQLTHEQRSDIARERMREYWKNRKKREYEENLKPSCADMLRFISNLKWQHNSIGQGHIIKWSSNENYQEIVTKLNDCLNLLDEMTTEQLDVYHDYLQGVVDKFVYKYDAEMLKSSYQYDEKGLSNGAVGIAIENMTEAYSQGLYILSVFNEQFNEDAKAEFNANEDFIDQDEILDAYYTEDLD